MENFCQGGECLENGDGGALLQESVCQKETVQGDGVHPVLSACI